MENGQLSKAKGPLVIVCHSEPGRHTWNSSVMITVVSVLLLVISSMQLEKCLYALPIIYNDVALLGTVLSGSK